MMPESVDNDYKATTAPEQLEASDEQMLFYPLPNIFTFRDGTEQVSISSLKASKAVIDDPLLVEDLNYALTVEEDLKERLRELMAREAELKEEIPKVAEVVELEAKRAREVVGVLRSKISGAAPKDETAQEPSALLRARERALSEEQRVLVKEIATRCETIESLTSLQHYLSLAMKLEDLQEQANALVELMIKQTQQRTNNKTPVEQTDFTESASILDLTLSLREIADVASSFGYSNLRVAAEEAEKQVASGCREKLSLAIRQALKELQWPSNKIGKSETSSPAFIKFQRAFVQLLILQLELPTTSQPSISAPPPPPSISPSPSPRPQSRLQLIQSISSSPSPAPSSSSPSCMVLPTLLSYTSSSTVNIHPLSASTTGLPPLLSSSSSVPITSYPTFSLSSSAISVPSAFNTTRITNQSSPSPGDPTPLASEIVTPPPSISLWAMDSLLEPIDTRFKFHFESKRQTNRIDKPEWMFMHVGELLSVHIEFVKNELANLFMRPGISDRLTTIRRRCDTKGEFLRGMVSMMRRRISLDANQLMTENNLALFIHLVSETIKFDKNMMSLYFYPPHSSTEEEFPTCLAAISDIESLREYWLSIENQVAASRFEVIITSVDAWTPMYKEEIAHDANLPLPTVSAHSIGELMKSVQERYGCIRNMNHRLLFAEEIQRAIANKYRKEIVAIHKLSLSSLKSEEQVALFAYMLNSLSYLELLLSDWDEQLFFLELQLVKEEKEAKQREEMERDEDENEEEEKQEKETGKTFFAETIKLYKVARKEMVDKLVNQLFKTFKDTTTSYFNNKHSWGDGLLAGQVEQHSERASLVTEISPDICEGLAFLRSRLEHSNNCLSLKNFSSVWKKLAKVLNAFVVEQIFGFQLSGEKRRGFESLVPMLLNITKGNKEVTFHFHLAGALQFQIDMSCILLIFKSYTPKPENYLRELDEACRILTLSAAEIKVLKQGAGNTQKSLLSSKQVFRVSLEQAKEIASRRIDA